MPTARHRPIRSLPTSVQKLVFVYGAGGLFAALWACSAYGIGSAIALPASIGGVDPRLLGLALWAFLCFATSASSVAQPGGAILYFALGPLTAASVLGGPAAAALIALIATFDLRELRGEVPWYGVVANHAMAAISWAIASVAMLSVGIAGLETSDPRFALAVMGGVGIALALNWTLAAVMTAARSGRGLNYVLRSSGGVGELPTALASEAALAWLVTWAYTQVWWSPLVLLLTAGASAKSLERRRAARDLRHHQLTDLPNGRALEDHFAAMRRRRAQGLAVVYLDLDGFKLINDRHGHQVGDDVLRVTGLRLTAACRRSDFLAHLHGDEFVVIAAGVSSELEASIIASRLVQAVEPVIVHPDGELRVGVTAGMRLVADMTDLEGAVMEADRMMNEAKAAKAQVSGRTRDRR